MLNKLYNQVEISKGAEHEHSFAANKRTGLRRNL